MTATSTNSAPGSSVQPVEQPIRRVLLLGFMASGKSTVGAVLARRLGWAHLDFDAEIERREGRSIAEIFRSDGEAAFRALEAELSAEVADLDDIVFSPGGGWITRPGLWELLQPRTLSVWLRISPEQVLARTSRSRTKRPLLDTADPRAVIRRLMREREPLYRAAELHVSPRGGGSRAAAARIEQVLRARIVASASQE